MKVRYAALFSAILIIFTSLAPFARAQADNIKAPARWTEQQANAWYQKMPWLVGSNFIPQDAVNQLEMWQADTFNPAEIDKEFGWAEALGMNTMRVFLHDLLWQQDPAGFKARIDQFLVIADRHHIRPIFVLFDSCWDPEPRLGPQRPPIPGVHNSGWVQSPGAAALKDRSQYSRLEDYVKGVVGAFSRDDRILAWDVWNEPSNGNGGTTVSREVQNKQAIVQSLLPQVFTWARSVHPIQPLTSGVWDVDYHSGKLTPMQQIQLDNSDIISFHNYSWPEEFQREVTWLRQFHRPLFCTEFMARSVGSTFDGILPIAKRENVPAINWGFVVGKTQTNLPWESWQHPYIQSQPPVWFHEVLRPDGTPYRQAEADLIRRLTNRAAPAQQTRSGSTVPAEAQ